MLDSRLKTEIPALVAPAVARPAIARACDSAVIRDVRGTGERHEGGKEVVSFTEGLSALQSIIIKLCARTIVL
jgi:hypothetical protein